MADISPQMFFFFRAPQRKQVKQMLRSHEGLRLVKDALIVFLAEWNDKDWVDWEKIDMVLRDLDHVNFWRLLPFPKFLADAESVVSTEIMDTLRKQPY